MLLSIFPETHVAATIRPFIDPVAMLLVVTVLALILLLVRPHILTEAMHIATLPLTDIVATILPLDHAIAIDFVRGPLAIEAGAVGPQVRPKAVFLPLCVVTQVLRAVRPRLLPLAMHLALKPQPAVDRPVCVAIDTVTTHEVAGPVALISVAVRVRELAIPTGLVAAPRPTVSRPVRPLHCALTVAHATQPLASIPGSCRLILIGHPFFDLHEFSHVERLRIRSIFAIRAPLGFDQLSEFNRLPILHLAKVEVRELLVVLLLQTQVLLEASLSEEATYTCLDLRNFVPILPVKLLVINVAVVLLQQGLSSQW